MSVQLKYELVMNYIKNEIYNGTLKEGDKLYSEYQLIEKFSVSRHTVREALLRLAQEGFITTAQGKGSFVAPPQQETHRFPPSSKMIAVIAAYMNNHTFPPIMDQIQQSARKNGYTVTISCTHNKVMQERECLKLLMESDVAGVIVEPSKSALPCLNDDLYGRLRARGIPVVFFHGFYHADTDDYVVVDDILAGYTATKHLLNRGHRNIGGVFKSDDIQGVYRYFGMMRALAEQDMFIEERNILWMSTQDEKIMMHDHHIKQVLLERLKQCSATICYNDDMAIQLADQLLQDGIRIPKQHSIISFDNTKYGSAYRVPITSMNHPYGELGSVLMEAFWQKLKNPNDKIQIRLTVELVEKATVSDVPPTC
ncbi:MAG: GntR family transcriptional regulator [Clostridia bacterium]